MSEPSIKGRFKLRTSALRAYTMLLALIVIWLFFQWATIDQHHPYGLFLGAVNFSKLLQQMAVTGVLAVGMLMVIVSGNIDLSVVALVVMGRDFIDPRIGFGLAIVAVAAIAWINIRRNRARQRHGLKVLTAGAIAVRILVPSVAIVAFIFLMNKAGGVPIPVIFLLAVALAGSFLTANTTFGRYLYAIGGNPDAARLSGINLRRYILAAFCVMGALAGLASILHTARVGSASPDAGNLMELDAIASCVIGGTSLMGGRGTVFGAVLGALILASLDNGMSLLNVESWAQYVVKGGVLVAAVGFDMFGRRKA